MGITISNSLASGMKNHGAIIGTKGDLLGQIVRMSKDKVYAVGRDFDQCDLVMTDERVSRRHCEICYNVDKQTYMVRDLSSNGTFINGELIGKNQEKEANPGDRVWICKEEQEIRLG